MNELIKLDSLDDITTFAETVRKFIYDKKLWMNIQGNGYVYVEGWQLMGGLLGITPIIEKVEDLSADNIIRYRAEVKLMRGDTVISSGVAICTNQEKGKTGFAEYAVASMAQTRAIGKAYRIYLGWIMKMAGFESTPLEEMETGGKTEESIDPQELDKAKANIENAKDEDELTDIVTSLPAELQKQVTEAAGEKFKELTRNESVKDVIDRYNQDLKGLKKK